jgi:hypothetical protein
MKYKLSPSDFAFLYEGCKRCYCLKVVHGISQPSIPLPSIFSKIAVLLKDHYHGKRTEALHPDLPPGTVKYGEQWVRSSAIRDPSGKAQFVINGRFDIVVEFDDGTYGVIDFKTGNPREGYSALYGRQLHAYAYALENPAPEALGLSPVTKLGLLYFYPSDVSQESLHHLSYDAEIKWIEVRREDQQFRQFIDEVFGILVAPDLPKPSEGCRWCTYLERMADFDIKGSAGARKSWKQGKLF